MSCGTEILPYARFGGDKFLVAGEDDGTVLFVGEVEEVVGVVRTLLFRGSMLWSVLLRGRWWRKKWQNRAP